MHAHTVGHNRNTRTHDIEASDLSEAITMACELPRSIRVLQRYTLFLLC